MNPRRSRLAYVVIRLAVGGRDCYLLRAHPKWGDWSLVGGHVEVDELSDWALAARREAEEELEPLRYGQDFKVVPIQNGPRQWGPVDSRSAGGASTVYEAEWFALVFLRDPEVCLARLPRDEFLLVDLELAVHPPFDAKVAPLLARLNQALPNGLASVPMAWTTSVDETPVRHAATTSAICAVGGASR